MFSFNFPVKKKRGGEAEERGQGGVGCSRGASEFYCLWGTPSLDRHTDSEWKSRGERRMRQGGTESPEPGPPGAGRPLLKLRVLYFLLLREFQNQPLVRILNGISSFILCSLIQVLGNHRSQLRGTACPFGTGDFALCLQAWSPRHCYLNGTHFQTERVSETRCRVRGNRGICLLLRNS